MNPQNLIAKVWDYANILRDSGVSYTDYVAQLSYLLFLKMESEIASVNPSAVSMIPSEFRWEVLKRLDGLELESAYSKALAELSKQGGIVGTIYQKSPKQNHRTRQTKTANKPSRWRDLAGTKCRCQRRDIRGASRQKRD